MALFCARTWQSADAGSRAACRVTARDALHEGCRETSTLSASTLHVTWLETLWTALVGLSLCPSVRPLSSVKPPAPLRRPAKHGPLAPSKWPAPLRGAVASSADHVECRSPNDPQGRAGPEKAGRSRRDCGLARARGLEGQARACSQVLGPCNGITPTTGAWGPGAAGRGQWER